MTSNILNNMGLGNIDIGILFIVMFVLILVLLVLLIVTMVKQRSLANKYKKFMKGTTAESLENEIMALFEDNLSLKKAVSANKKDIRQLYKNMEKTIQKVGLVKYDAYQQMGGLLSFSLVLLDENNDGIVLNSVHSSDGCYTYTKEINDGKCAIGLGNEEKQALDQAMGIEEK